MKVDRGRRKKVRYIQKMPHITHFSPRGKAGRPDEIELTLDEFEAIRLADFQALSHIDAAKSMGISRPTFGRVVNEARKKVAAALIGGKSIHIRIGKAQVGVRKDKK